MVQMCRVHELSGFRMVWVHRHQNDVPLETRHFSPVFEWLAIILTSVDICPVFKCLKYLNTRLYKVRYSDESGIRMSGIQMVTVFKYSGNRIPTVSM